MITKSSGPYFRERLTLLSQTIIEDVTARKGRGELGLIRQIYVRRRVTHFGYRKGNIELHQGSEYVEREEWSPRGLHEFLDKVVATLPIYAEVVQRIVETYAVGEHAAQEWLRAYAWRLCYE